MSRKLLLAATVCLALAGQASAQSHAGHHPAVADPGRPAEDVQRDADRKPAEMLAFAEVKPGQVIGELLPGRGYFTRIFAKAVGPKGKVYAIVPESQAAASPPPPVDGITADPAYGNVRVVATKLSAIGLPEKADLIWTSQNYHDLRLGRLKLDPAAVNRSVFEALKPGGLYVVLDHAARPGSGPETAETLHRIDPAIVRREVEAAGFRFEGESPALRNPADDHTQRVFEAGIRGRTDQFIYKFRKPR